MAVLIFAAVAALAVAGSFLLAERRVMLLGGERPASPETWGVIVAGLVAALLAGMASRAILDGAGPSTTAFFLATLIAGVGAADLARRALPPADPVAAAKQKAAAGDPDGAIASLRALLDRRRDPSIAPAAPAADPWAAPRAPTAPDRDAARILLALGAIEADRGRWADALAWLDQVEAADPADSRAAAPRAAALAHLGRADEAVDLLRAALERAPTGYSTARGPLLADLAGLLIDREQDDAARPLLDEAETLWRRTITIPTSTRSAALARLAALRARLASGEAPA